MFPDFRSALSGDAGRQLAHWLARSSGPMLKDGKFADIPTPLRKPAPWRLRGKLKRLGGRRRGPLALSQIHQHVSDINSCNVLPHRVVAAPVEDTHEAENSTVTRNLDSSLGRLGQGCGFSRQLTKAG